MSIADLLEKLTLREKIYLLSGVDGWQTFAIAHLGVGSLKVCTFYFRYCDAPLTGRRQQMVQQVQGESSPSTAPMQLFSRLQCYKLPPGPG